MRRTPAITTFGIALSAALALAGCGGSATSTHKEAVVPLKSAAMAGRSVPALYTCDGKDIHPPLEWGAVPAGTRELALFLVGLTPVPSSRAYSVSIDWAVSGVNPALHRLAAGQLPAGAHVGAASDNKKRYSLCPKKGTTAQYIFELYGLPAGVSIAPDFNGGSVITALSSRKSSNPVNAHGSLIAFYRRR